MFQNRRREMYIERTKPTCPATVFFFSAAGQIKFNYSYYSRWLLAIFQPAEYFL